ncbi:hypothetical protein ACT6QH_00215, partial [Xanthobacter sp. TB0139]|uniref:hypothetical protein n=1 Tax=Xanthobacter sp. TB0139 TaxID=3459178 RepID=UPI00403A4601
RCPVDARKYVSLDENEWNKERTIMAQKTSVFNAFEKECLGVRKVGGGPKTAKPRTTLTP